MSSLGLRLKLFLVFVGLIGLAIASADYSTYAPVIKPTDTELTQFFEQSGGRYDIQPQVAATFVDFPALAHLPTVTVTDADGAKHVAHDRRRSGHQLPDGLHRRGGGGEGHGAPKKGEEMPADLRPKSPMIEDYVTHMSLKIVICRWQLKW